jgi:hypothetical protein
MKIKAFELIFSAEGKIIGEKELDIKTLTFKGNYVYQDGKKLQRHKLLIK